MTKPTKNMQRLYKGLARSAQFKWCENTEHHESYLYLAGHRVATVKVARFGPWMDAHCLGGLVATRKSLKAAKAAAVDATLAWLAEATRCVEAGVKP